MSDSVLDWFLLTPEQRADKEIRADLALANQSLRAISQTSREDTDRLRRQVTAQTASIEERLTRLAASFAAFVELTELRQLMQNSYGDSVEQRQQAITALTKLASNEAAQPLVPDPTYWLPDAVNAMIAIVAGTPDRESEARARALDPRADEFFVLAAAALDKPEAVADRVPEVLVTDGSFSPSQYLLWRAALAGDFGPMVDKLRPSVEPAISKDGWAAWIEECADKARMSTIGWLERLTRPISRPDEPISQLAREFLEKEADKLPKAVTAAPGPGRTESQKALTAMMVAMVQEGKPSEREFSARERTLRAIVADPGAANQGDPGLGDDRNLTDDLRSALLDESLDPGVRRLLVSWALPHLRAALADLPRPLNGDAVAKAVVAGRTVTVTTRGYDEQQALSYLASGAERTSAAKRLMVMWAAGAAAVLAAGAILLLAGQSWGSLIIAVAAVAGWFAFARWREWRSVEQQEGVDRVEAAEELAAAATKVTAIEASISEERARYEAAEELVRVRLATPSRS
jgi:hypothetical protein